MVNFSGDNIDDTERLFACLAEQVKLPLIQVAHTAENFNHLNEDEVHAAQQSILEISRAATRLIDGFLLSVKIRQDNSLFLEPVSMSSVIYDVASSLKDYAKIQNCTLDIQISGKYKPVMSRPEVVRLALLNLVHGFLSGQGVDDEKKLKIGLRRNAHGLSVGVFSERLNLSSDLLKKARQLYGRVHQPFVDFSGDNAAGVFVADSLLSATGVNMKVSRYGELKGLAATFTPSHQLSLV